MLQRELENMWDFMNQTESIRLPINPAMEITGVDAKVLHSDLPIQSVSSGNEKKNEFIFCPFNLPVY